MPPRQVEQFGPKLLAFLKRGAIEPIKVKVPTRAKGTTLRHRLYSLRKAMERERHPDFPTVQRVEITMEELLGEWYVKASNVDTTFDDILDTITIPDAPEAP